MLAAGTTSHSYGHCWRCDTGIIQIVTDQWFITITDVKEGSLDNIGDSGGIPSGPARTASGTSSRTRRTGTSPRQRYWGIPIPIWLPADWSGDMDEALVVADRDELAERVDQDVDPESIDLHKDTVDDLTITEDGVAYERVPDVFDVWLDSSVATWGLSTIRLRPRPSRNSGPPTSSSGPTTRPAAGSGRNSGWAPPPSARVRTSAS